MAENQKIKFKLNSQKAIESILYVLSKKESVNMYNVLKIIFEAEKSHLNDYGRPITGDLIYKMEYGTVPLSIYNMLKNATISSADRPFRKVGYNIIAARKPNVELLSETDLEALDLGCSKYLNLSFEEVKILNHEEICWKNGKLNQAIPFEEIITSEDALDYIRDTTSLNSVG